MQEWHDFFVAQVGATAALTGLLFVALSVNIAPILKYPWLPPRAAQTVIVLSGAIVESSLQLFPLPSIRWTSALLGTVAAIVYMLALRLSLRAISFGETRSDGNTRRVQFLSGAVTQVATLPCLIGAAIGFAGRPGFEYWVAAGIVLSLLFGLYNSWVLLVEILR
jgi:modulator of FtsH protease